MKTTILLYLLVFALGARTVFADARVDAFLDRLAAVESNGDDAAVNEAGGAHGRYQVTQPYLDDANALLGTAYTLADMHDPAKARRVVCAYLAHYGARYVAETGRACTAEVLARIHNGGPRGWAKAATDHYAEKFAATEPQEEN